MKRPCLLLVLLITVMSSCKKTSSTTTNIIDTTTIKPQFVVNGLSDITLSNDFNFYAGQAITVQYLDSAQESVSLSLSGLPVGVGMDSSWQWSGIPSFTTTLTVFDTASAGVAPGKYPLTLTATTASGNKKLYSFNLIIQPMPTNFLGKYTNCRFACSGSTLPYTDSLYLDPATRNKIWFTNFANTGSGVYGFVILSALQEPSIVIPEQTIGTDTYSAPEISGDYINLSAHSFNVAIIKNGFTGSCNLNMR